MVTSWNPGLIAKFTHQTFVIQTDRPEEIPEIHRVVNDRNGLFCIHLTVNTVLTAIPFHENWEEIPVYISCKGMGNFKEFLLIKPLLSKLNLKIFLPANSHHQFTAARILASLGIQVGIILSPDIDWEMINDLMVYSVYSKAPHAQIEPFRFVLDHYHPTQKLNMGSLYFDDPEKFLYIDQDENIATTLENLAARKFIGKGANALENIHNNPEYLESIQSWQKYFLKTDGCAYCKAWRICLGRYYDHTGKNNGCVEFFSDLLDAADNFKKIKPGEN